MTERKALAPVSGVKGEGEPSGAKPVAVTKSRPVSLGFFVLIAWATAG